VGLGGSLKFTMCLIRSNVSVFAECLSFQCILGGVKFNSLKSSTYELTGKNVQKLLECMYILEYFINFINRTTYLLQCFEDVVVGKTLQGKRKHLLNGPTHKRPSKVAL
jgi:hypothetical protein